MSEKYILTKNNALEMLIISLNLLGKLSPLGYGNIELCIRNWVLIDINSSVRDRVEANIKDILEKKGMFETPDRPILFNKMKTS